MGIFGRPNSEKLRAKRDIKGLIGALKEFCVVPGDGEAAKALLEIGEPAVEPLIAALRHSNKNVRANAAGVLGKMGVTRAVEPLIAALKDGKEDVRMAAVWALRDIGDPRAREPLQAALQDESEAVRARAVEALAKLKGPKAIELLISSLKSGDKGVRSEAAEALGQSGDSRAVEPLIAALTAEVGSAMPPAVAARPPVIRRAWSRQEGAARESIVQALGRLGDRRAVDALRVTLKDPNDRVRLAAMQVLQQLGERGAAKALATSLLSSEEWLHFDPVEVLIRDEAARALAAMDDSSSR